MPSIPPPSSPYYSDAATTLYAGDCLEVLRSLPDASVDAVCTDPPYGLEFMGKAWDGADGFRRSLNLNDVGRDNAFGRTSKTSPEYRTTPRYNAGFAPGAPAAPGVRGEIKSLPSFTGSTNPTCTNCGGTRNGNDRKGRRACRCEKPQFPNTTLPQMHTFQSWCEAWSRECLRVLRPGGHMLAFGGTRTWHRLACAVEDAGFEVRDSLAWLYGSGFPKSLNLVDEDGERTGWGTALKPAFEPIVVARKPLAGTVAANVLAHGTGALNIDGCRVGTGDNLGRPASDAGDRGSLMVHDGSHGTESRSDSMFRFTPETQSHPAGRWPANVILDKSQAAELDTQSGVLTSGKMLPTHTTAGVDGRASAYGKDAAGGFMTMETYGDTGGASRFFYVAKADQSERVRVDGIAHPTVKPLDLMRWLVRLVTPPGGTVLEPFAGSGTTVEACILEGFKCIAIEREETYLPLIVQRINRRRDPVAAVKATGDDGGLFDLLGEATA